MALQRWAAKLTPAVPSDLVLDAFELAMEIRYVDMRASPYDVSDMGLAPIPIETPEGKAEYARFQVEFAARAGVLRERIIDICAVVRNQAGALVTPGA